LSSREATFGALVAAGPRAGEHTADYAFVFESVFEGYLLHYGGLRLEAPDDPDQRLLEGDLAYALGLARLAELGDLEAVSELADLISLCAQVHVEDRAGDEPVAAALWALSALAVGAGPWPGHAAAKDAVRARTAGAGAEALEEARAKAVSLGIEDDLNSALIAFKAMVRAPSRST
jgi:hypothetical protein